MLDFEGSGAGMRSSWTRTNAIVSAGLAGLAVIILDWGGGVVGLMMTCSDRVCSDLKCSDCTGGAGRYSGEERRVCFVTIVSENWVRERWRGRFANTTSSSQFGRPLWMV